VLTELSEAGRLAGELRVELNKAADASNRAVMADTDEASVAFAREAVQAKGVISTDVAAIGPVLRSLGHVAEVQFLGQFEMHFAAYEKLDATILELAIENTNLKAQRLSFGPAREAADAFRAALTAVTAGATSKDRRRVESLVAEAVIAVREIQVLQAPHIAESEDSVMTGLETQMAALQATAADAAHTLSGLVEPKARPQVAAALAALDRFQGVSKEIIKLSRRNSNVRSLELSLRRKPAVTAACDESLRALQDALAKEAFAATR
jgi:paraquat-inducible protein B